MIRKEGDFLSLSELHVASYLDSLRFENEEEKVNAITALINVALNELEKSTCKNNYLRYLGLD
ncbi:hypothetical protein [Zophobihabitans entericus]|uniref:Uncharacterized protein n=1 Tax=Zophobihabitans entericus TaxID=1635327 RepID=A0A6G9IE45_9GAMM|nr:hypothetical protein [Zophobihabitans entericus]QIQ22508.1 hypothetical protein IPMB12_11920 [Zophobihabitans entericus]